MTSNEHPDMHGNPCDDPILCDQCGGACNESDLYGSIHDENKIFCRKQCVDNWECGLAPVQEELPFEIDKLLTIRDYLRERRDDPTTTAETASVLSVEVLRLNEMIRKAEAEAEA